MLLAAAAVSGVLSAHTFSLDARSSQVQHHGLHATGVVQTVQAQTSCSPDPHGSLPCFTSATFSIALAPPARGIRETTVHQTGSAEVRVHQRVKVLLDPEHLSYAELPGRPYRHSGGWISTTLIALGLAVLAGLEAYRRYLRPPRVSHPRPQPTT